MTATPESPTSEVHPEQPPLAAETTQPAGSAEPAPALTGEIDTQITTERHKLRERIRQSSSLSHGLRDRLTALLAGEPPAASDSQPLLRADSVLALLEEAIPPQLWLDASSLAQPEHPAGDVFFTGDVNQMTDDQAERIAREQLSRSAFGRR